MGLLKVDSVAAEMFATTLTLALFSCLHAAPLDKSLQKGGVHAIAPCKDCGPTADLTALGEGGDQVSIDSNEITYIPQRILFHLHHLPLHPSLFQQLAAG